MVRDLPGSYYSAAFIPSYPRNLWRQFHDIWALRFLSDTRTSAAGMETSAEDLFFLRYLCGMVDRLRLGQVSLPRQLASEQSTAMDALDLCCSSSVLHIGAIALACEAGSKKQ